MLGRCVPGLRKRSNCLKLSSSESKRKFNRKIQGEVPNRAGLRGVRTEVDIPIDAACLKRSLLDRTVADFLSDGAEGLDDFFYSNLIDLKRRIKKIPDAILHAVNNRLMVFQLDAASVIDSGQSFKSVLTECFGEVCVEVTLSYSPGRAEEISSFNRTLIALPALFFSNYLQKSEEGEDELPGENDWLVDPDIVEKHPDKYRWQRLGMRVGQFCFASATAFLGYLLAGGRGSFQLDYNDLSGFMTEYIGICENRYNMTRTEAITRIMNDPDFVVELGNGQDPVFTGTQLALFSSLTLFLMAVLSYTANSKIPQYVGILLLMPFVKCFLFLSYLCRFEGDVCSRADQRRNAGFQQAPQSQSASIGRSESAPRSVSEYI